MWSAVTCHRFHPPLLPALLGNCFCRWIAGGLLAPAACKCESSKVNNAGKFEENLHLRGFEGDRLDNSRLRGNNSTWHARPLLTVRKAPMQSVRVPGGRLMLLRVSLILLPLDLAPQGLLPVPETAASSGLSGWSPCHRRFSCTDRISDFPFS